MQINQTFVLNEDGNVEYPDVFLCRRNHSKIGLINNVENLKIIVNEKASDEISFDTHKYLDNIECSVWDKLTDLRCVYVKGFGYFEISVTTTDENEVVKSVVGMSQAHNELSQINATLEINTDVDLEIHDGKLTQFYDNTDTDCSLIHRILTYAPHYKIGTVDVTLQNITKEFTFDTDIMSIFDEISEENECLFVVDSETRTVNVYDLKNTCKDCLCRKIKDGVCTKCGSKNIKYGYGKDTQVFISSENLADTITLEGDKDSVKNCLKIKSADELMDAAVAQINPNGTNKIYKFTDVQLNDMSDELVQKLSDYNTAYNNSKSEYEDLYNKILTSEQTIANYQYNMSPTLETVSGYTCDEMMQAVMDKYNGNKIAVLNYSSISGTTAQNNVKRRIKQMLAVGFELSFGDYTFSNHVYTGEITIKDTINSTEINIISNTQTITINITDANSDSEYKTYLEQQFEEVLKKVNVNKIDTIISHLNEWSISMLSNYSKAIEECISALINTGCGVKPNSTSSSLQGEKYNLYLTWREYLEKINNRIKELDELVEIETAKKETYENRRQEIQDSLNIVDFIGETLWYELCSYIREDTYDNSNFSSEFDSDELKPDKIIKRAKELYELAEEELDKSSVINYSLTATLHNLLVMKEFKVLKDKIEIGNYIRVEVDGELKKLKLISIEFDFENIDMISMTFSDVVNAKDETSAIKSILNQAASVATSFDSVKRKSDKGNKTFTDFQKIKNEGLSAALFNIKNADEENFLIGQDGVTMKRGNEESGYDDRQLKIIHNMIAMTDDGWNSVRLAIGQGKYNGQDVFGVWGDVIVGNILASEKLIVSNEKATFIVDGDEVRITDGSLYITNGETYTKIDNRDENIIEIGKGKKEPIELIESFECFANGALNYNTNQHMLYKYNPNGGYYTTNTPDYTNYYHLSCSCNNYIYHTNGRFLYRLDCSKLNSEFVLVKSFSDIIISALIQSDRDDVIYFIAFEKTESSTFNANIYEYNISDDTYDILCYYDSGSKYSYQSFVYFFIKNNVLYSYGKDCRYSIYVGSKDIPDFKSALLPIEKTDVIQKITFSDLSLNMILLSHIISYNGMNYCVACNKGDNTIFLCKIDLSTGNLEAISSLITYDGSNSLYNDDIHCFILNNKFHLVFNFSACYIPKAHCIYDFETKNYETVYDAPVTDDGVYSSRTTQISFTVNNKIHFLLKEYNGINNSSHYIYYANENAQNSSEFKVQINGLGFKSSRQNSYCNIGDVIYHTTGNDYSNEVYKLDTSKPDAEWELAYTLENYTIYNMIQSDSDSLVYQMAKNITTGNYDLIAYNLTDNTFSKVVDGGTSYGFIKNNYLYYYRTRLYKTDLSTGIETKYDFYSGGADAGNYYCLSYGIEIDGYIYALMYLNEKDYIHLCKISIDDGTYTKIFKFYYDIYHLKLSGYSLFLYNNKINIILYNDYYTSTPHIYGERFIYDIKKNIVYKKNDMFEYYGYDDIDKTSSYYTCWLPSVTTSNGVHFFLGQKTFNDNGENGGYQHILYTENNVNDVENPEDNKIFYVTNKGDGYFNGSITTYNGNSSVVINKDKDKIIDINTPKGNVFYIDEYGDLHISGCVEAGTINIGDGTFSVLEDGTVSINKGSLCISNGSTYTKIDQDSENIIEVGKYSGDNTDKIFYVTKSGDGVFKGSIIANAGSIGGWNIEYDETYGSYLQSTDNKTSGEMQLLAKNGEIRSRGNYYDTSSDGWYARLYSGKWIFGLYDSTDPWQTGDDRYSDISVNGIFMRSKQCINSGTNQYLLQADTSNDLVSITSSSSNPALSITNNSTGNCLYLENVSCGYENAAFRSKVVCNLMVDGTITESRSGYVTIFGEAAKGRIVFRTDNGTNVSGCDFEDSAIGTVGCRWGEGYFNDLYSVGAVNTSDLKLKDVIGDLDITQSIDFIKSLKPISFTFKDSEHKRIHMGFGAQDIAKSCKDLNMGDMSIYTAIGFDDDGNELYYKEDIPEEKLEWGIKYNELIAPIVKTLQYQQNIIEELQKEINELKEK